MSLKLIYEKDVAYFIKLYKPYDIIEYINSNYAYNLKDWNLIIDYCFFIHRAIII